MASTARAFVLNARAKLNLYLEVGAPEPSGLHAIRSVVTNLLVCDEVAFLPTDRGFTVSCDNPAIPDRANLAGLAAQALCVPLPNVRIHVRKALPIEAGLGGGSADAAAALRGLRSVLADNGVTLSPDTLLAAAARVGSDVPACFVAGLKVVEGTGEAVRPIPSGAPGWGVLLLMPAVRMPTRDAYALLDRARAAGRSAASARPDSVDAICDAYVREDFGRTCALVRNDFQPVIEASYPAIREARLRIVAAGAAATLLCGSGACVAGLFENVSEAQKALTLVRPGPGEWAAATGFADGE